VAILLRQWRDTHLPHTLDAGTELGPARFVVPGIQEERMPIFFWLPVIYASAFWSLGLADKETGPARTD
jgi:hypothetical protein